MECLIYSPFSCAPLYSNVSKFSSGVVFASGYSRKKTDRNKKVRQQLPKNLRNRRRTEILPDFRPVLRRVEETDPEEGQVPNFDFDSDLCSFTDQGDDEDTVVWGTDEIEAISSLFRGRVPQKPGKLSRERPLPLPLPHKIRPLGFPTSKKLVRTHLSRSLRQPLSNLIYKNPDFLIKLAREIRSLPPESNVSAVLNQWSQYLRKGSLSLTIRELGDMGLPNRALNVFSWVQEHPHLFPDDRILASTVEVLAAASELKMPFDLDEFITLSSRSVYEAVVKGSIKGGNLGLAWRLIHAAIEGKRTLDSSIYVKLILELGKNPDKHELIIPLLEELANKDDLKLTQQDCTAVMKVCIRMTKFDIVEALYDWFKHSGIPPTAVMYTTIIHSRYTEGRYREAMAIVWEMEASECLLDLPAYRVLIKLFAALNDVPRISRYFNKLEECGFSPSWDIYRSVIGMYMDSGRLAKCKQIVYEAERAGFKIDKHIKEQLS